MISHEDDLHEDNLTGRQPHRKTSHRQRKTIAEEDNLTGRQFNRKTTSHKENHIGRRTRRKTTSQTDELQPNRIKISHEGNIALYYVVN